MNAIEQGYKVAAYSGELPAQKFLEWILLQATESNLIDVKMDERNGKYMPFVGEKIQKNIRSWIDGKFFLYDNSIVEETNQTESILRVFTMCARKYGCKLFLLDNLMSSLMSPDEENKAQARFMSQIKSFAGKFKCHVIVVA